MPRVAKIDHEDLLRAALHIRGAVENDRFRFCSAGKKSFLESGDGRTRVVASLPISGAHFDLSLPYGSFQKLCKLFSSPIEAWREEGQLCLRQDSRQVSLRAEDTEDTSPPPLWSAPKEIWQVSGKEFRESLQNALRAASADPGRPVLRSVALVEEEGRFFFVSTDSFRLLALPLGGEHSNPLPRPLLLPRDTARAIAADIQRSKPEEVFLEYGEEGDAWGGTIAYDSAAWHFFSPEGNFPDWRELLHGSGETLEVARDEIHSLLQFVEALAGRGKPEQNGAAALRLDLGEEVVARFQRPGLGEVSQTLQRAVWRGQPRTIGANPLFLRDMLDVLEGEKLQGQTNESSGGLVFSGRGDRRYLLMPVRLSEL